MKEQMLNLLKDDRFVISNNIIKVALEKELSLNEFLVLVYFDNCYDKSFDIDLVGKAIGLPSDDTMEAFNGLMVKGLVSLDSVKDADNRINEVVNLEGLYQVIMDNISVKSKKDTKEDIFKTFESELGRTMSSMELELINGWLSNGTPEEIILGALREAIYNGVNNFRYIDKIIYEWEKKGFKTMDDVNNYLESNRKDKKSSKLRKEEENILDYDWLG